MLISADELRKLKSLSNEDEEKINKYLYSLITMPCSGILCGMGEFVAPDLLIEKLKTVGYTVTVYEDQQKFFVQL